MTKPWSLLFQYFNHRIMVQYLLLLAGITTRTSLQTSKRLLGSWILVGGFMDYGCVHLKEDGGRGCEVREALHVTEYNFHIFECFKYGRQASTTSNDHRQVFNIFKLPPYHPYLPPINKLSVGTDISSY